MTQSLPPVEAEACTLLPSPPSFFLLDSEIKNYHTAVPFQCSVWEQTQDNDNLVGASRVQ